MRPPDKTSCCEMCSTPKPSVAVYGKVKMCAKHDAIIKAIVREDQERKRDYVRERV